MNLYQNVMRKQLSVGLMGKVLGYRIWNMCVVMVLSGAEYCPRQGDASHRVACCSRGQPIGHGELLLVRLITCGPTWVASLPSKEHYLISCCPSDWHTWPSKHCLSTLHLMLGHSYAWKETPRSFLASSSSCLRRSMLRDGHRNYACPQLPFFQPRHWPQKWKACITTCYSLGGKTMCIINFFR